MNCVTFILKLVGFGLLFVMLFVLLILILGLCLPIRYEVDLKKDECFTYHIKIRYLFFIQAYFMLDDQKEEQEVKIFWKKIYSHQEAPLTDYEKGKEYVEKAAKRIEQIEKKRLEQVDSQPVKEEVKVSQVFSKSAKESSKYQNQLESDEKEIKDSLKSVLHFLKDDAALELLKSMIGMFYRFIKHVLPKKWAFEMILGCEDPADTGSLLAKLAVLYPFYAAHGKIMGDFNKPCFDVWLDLEGYVQLGWLGVELVRLFCQKKSRDIVIQMIKEMKG